MTVHKNLRSRKGQEEFAVPESPANKGKKRKKETKDEKNKKAKLAKVKKEEEEEEIKIVTSDDSEEKPAEKPVVIEETFECPQPDCFKKYKAQR